MTRTVKLMSAAVAAAAAVTAVVALAKTDEDSPPGASAARLCDLVGAVASRGGRPDLAGDALDQIRTPTLLIVGGDDFGVIELNEEAFSRLRGPKSLEIVAGEADIRLGSDAVEGRPGTWIHLPANLPHSIVARTPLTMLLTLLKRGR